MQSLNGQWMLATDPQNVGKEKRWFEGGPIEGAQDSTVPGIIQQTFPGYHGVVWYWQTLTPYPIRINLRESQRTRKPESRQELNGNENTLSLGT